MQGTIEVTLDYPDAGAAAAFWAAALGYERRYARPPYEVIGPPAGEDGPTLVLQQVPVPATASRVHLDLRVPDPEATVARLCRLGATVREVVAEAGRGWTVMVDPWGTVLCVCPAR
jgi:predicted enzyme related to lactoylglutathione lyase